MPCTCNVYIQPRLGKFKSLDTQTLLSAVNAIAAEGSHKRLILNFTCVFLSSAAVL